MVAHGRFGPARPKVLSAMIVRKFLAWSREVSSGERALGLGALARGYLHSGLTPDLRREAEAALGAALDDPSPQVRRALAEALAGEAHAPRHIIIALATDQPDIAALVLARSPLLTEGDLVDGASMGDRLMQGAIATRSGLSATVATVLAEKGHPDALVMLARNVSADIPDGFSFAYG